MQLHGCWTDRGLDEVEFFISPNPGEEVRALARIASGGELSRIMLALQHRGRRQRMGGRTLIFDEVDAGVGGAAADAVGARLQALGPPLSDALHYAPAADCGARGAALSDREASERRPNGHVALIRLDVRSRTGDRAHDRRSRGLGPGPGLRP